MSYLEDKGIKFKDERLNSVIDVVALTKNGKNKIDFLIKNLTPEAIEVIDSKQYVINIPGKNGCVFETYLDDDFDPSCGRTTLFVGLAKNGVLHEYKFLLWRFHDRCGFSGAIFEYDESVRIYDENNEIDSFIPVENKDMKISIVRKTGEKFFEFEGLLVENESNEVICEKKKINMDNLLNSVRNNLRERKYYQAADRETYRLHYKNKYDYFNSDKQIDFAQYFEMVASANDCAFHINHGICEEGQINPVTEYNMLVRRIQEINLSELEEGNVEYEAWCLDKGLKPYTYYVYDEWIENNKNKESLVVNMDSVPVFKKVNEEAPRSSVYYNPNKNRYYEEDEEDIVINNKR